MRLCLVVVLVLARPPEVPSRIFNKVKSLGTALMERTHGQQKAMGEKDTTTNLKTKWQSLPLFQTLTSLQVRNLFIGNSLMTHMIDIPLAFFIARRLSRAFYIHRPTYKFILSLSLSLSPSGSVSPCLCMSRRPLVLLDLGLLYM